MIGSGHELSLRFDDDGAAHLSSIAWPSLALDVARSSLRVDGELLRPVGVTIAATPGTSGCVVTQTYADGLALELTVSTLTGPAIELRGVLRNDGDRDRELNDVVLLGIDDAGRAAFSAEPARACVLEQGNYWGRVRRIGVSPEDERRQGEPDGVASRVHGASDNVWAIYDPAAPAALIAGFLTSERWLGRVTTEADASGAVHAWCLGFDGADVLLPAGSRTRLEEAILLVGDDPWHLLCDYGDRVAARHGTVVGTETPVSWCSWYPYRLGVTEERILETARIAAARLAPLGLSVVEIDLGWQAGNLPSTFDENERFPGDLRRLADALEDLGLRLGVWSAPYSISALDPMAREHPEYLILGADGSPATTGTWFWEPHGDIHILDLTAPGAQAWLRERMTSLADRGVSYLKPDFIGCVAHPQARQRHDRRIASGGGTEAGRIGARIISEALPEATVLNCGGPEMPGTGALPLLYSCNDTGNTGFIGTAFRRRNTLTLACHLWKNRRWGILQPSCLCVGLPGTVEDARLRATIAFLAGGQIDISDTLQSLPEDRWAILTATLPSLGASATPVDLFAPLPAVPFGYEQSTRGTTACGEAGPDEEELPQMPPGSVWHLRVQTDWDAWDLVGVLCYAEDADADSPAISRYVIPFERLGIAPDTERVGYEFWSSQFVGTVPGGRSNAGGYTHPGDFQDLLAGAAPGTLDVAFYGPAAKLICLRAPRSHPWIAGTTFHQSCGAELADVYWDEARGELRGTLCRPAGETGTLTLTTAGRAVTTASVDDRPAVVRAQGDAVVLPLTTQSSSTHWQLRFT